MTMTDAQTAIVARWAKPNQIPFKNQLISDRGRQGDDNVCMCAQGQVLHYIGGWSFRQLRTARQADADKATADLLGISRAHAVLLRNINDSEPGAPSVVLTNPELVLGDTAATILAFWKYLDTMTKEDWAILGEKMYDIDWNGVVASKNAAIEFTSFDIWNVAFDAAVNIVNAHAPNIAVVAATAEIMGAELLRESSEYPFKFLPLFGFANPQAIDIR